jgi:hypothetical protein
MSFPGEDNVEEKETYLLVTLIIVLSYCIFLNDNTTISIYLKALAYKHKNCEKLKILEFNGLDDFHVTGFTRQNVDISYTNDLWFL